MEKLEFLSIINRNRKLCWHGRSWWFLSKLKRIIWNNLTYMYITEWTEVFKQKLFTSFQSSTLQNSQYVEKNPNTHQQMYKQNNIFTECDIQSLQWIKWINKHGILLRTPILIRPDNGIFYWAECCGLWKKMPVVWALTLSPVSGRNMKCQPHGIDLHLLILYTSGWLQGGELGVDSI